jgi:N-acetylglucosamine-6-sulfatase
LITTDDQRLSDLAHMPATRALIGDQGVEFTSGLSPHPLCCPARAEILTGQYAQNNGVASNYGIDGGFQALRHPADTLPSWLQDAGYRTGFVGKYLNGHHWRRDGAQPGWDWWDPTIRGVYNYRNFVQANDVEPWRYRNAYITDDDPFFIWASYVAPHGGQRPDGPGLGPCPRGSTGARRTT